MSKFVGFQTIIRTKVILDTLSFEFDQKLQHHFTNLLNHADFADRSILNDNDISAYCWSVLDNLNIKESILDKVTQF